MILRQKKNGIIYQNFSNVEELDPNFSQPRYQGSKAKIELLRVFTYIKLNTVPNSSILYISDMIFYFNPEKKFSLLWWRLPVRFSKRQFSFFPTDSLCYTFLNTNKNTSFFCFLSKAFLWSRILQTMYIFFFETIRWYFWHERLPKPKIFHACWLLKWLNVTLEIMARPGGLAARHFRIKPQSITTMW